MSRLIRVEREKKRGPVSLFFLYLQRSLFNSTNVLDVVETFFFCVCVDGRTLQVLMNFAVSFLARPIGIVTWYLTFNFSPGSNQPAKKVGLVSWMGRRKRLVC